MGHTHEEAQKEELAFWNTPGAELGEQLKQLTYAKYLGLNFEHDGSSPYVINKTGLRIMDIGGGPVSLLLKTIAQEKIVVDPCPYAEWVEDRYLANSVNWLDVSGETFYKPGFKLENKADEVWMYNVLQHTEDPKKIFDNIYTVLKDGGKFRFLDWIDTPTNVAHPITLSESDIFVMIEAAGFDDHQLHETKINENGAVGKIAYGVFTK